MGAFAKQANELLDLIQDKEPAALEPWQEKLKAQEAQLYKHIPPAEVEAEAKAQKKIELLRRLAYTFGHQMRAGKELTQLQEREGDESHVPGREVMISLPGVKQAAEKQALLGLVAKPLLHALQNIKLEAQRVADEQITEGTRSTGSPETLATYYPRLATEVPKAFQEGYGAADKEQREQAAATVSQELAKARKEFDEALMAEYSASKKAASAGELLDGLAEAHTKEAAGGLNTIMGTYLTLASLLFGGSHELTKKWMEARDPEKQKYDASRELFRRRAYQHPPAILVDPDATSEANIEPKAKVKLTAPEAKEEMDAIQDTQDANA